jgi:hypothetical protein
MDDSRFDAWTRRRFGKAVGGGFASFIRLGPLAAVAALARPGTTRAKRCINVRKPCNPEGDRRRDRCCGHLRCGKLAGRNGDRCCRPLRAACRRESECCNNLRCDTTIQGGNRCCVASGGFCQRDQDCCRGARCDTFERTCA